MNNKTTSTTGVSGLFLLGILFVALKLTGYIDWSWWWVTLPFWGSIVLVIGVILVILLIAIISDE